MSLALPAFHTVCCCCSCAALQRRGRRFRIRWWTSEEEEQLIDAVEAWMKDTGRTCGDFFKTLGTPGNPDGGLADRPTLLAKVTNLNDAEALFASTTICARVPRAKKRPPPLAPPPPPPEIAHYGIQYYEVSGFGFTRPFDRGPYTLTNALNIVANFKIAHPYPSLEGASVVDLTTIT